MKWRFIHWWWSEMYSFSLIRVNLHFQSLTTFRIDWRSRSVDVRRTISSAIHSSPTSTPVFVCMWYDIGGSSMPIPRATRHVGAPHTRHDDGLRRNQYWVIASTQLHNRSGGSGNLYISPTHPYNDGLRWPALIFIMYIVASERCPWSSSLLNAWLLAWRPNRPVYGTAWIMTPHLQGKQTPIRGRDAIWGFSFIIPVVCDLLLLGMHKTYCMWFVCDLWTLCECIEARTAPRHTNPVPTVVH